MAIQWRTGERASEMESYGVCMSARETQTGGIPALASLSHSHKRHKTPSHSHVPQSVPVAITIMKLPP